MSNQPSTQPDPEEVIATITLREYVFALYSYPASLEAVFAGIDLAQPVPLTRERLYTIAGCRPIHAFLTNVLELRFGTIKGYAPRLIISFDRNLAAFREAFESLEKEQAASNA